MRKIFILLACAMISLLLSAEDVKKSERFYFFYSDSCPHCHEAMPFVDELEKEFPDIEFKRLELTKVPENMAIFNKKAEKLGIKGGGVPTFVFRDRYIVGFKKGVYEEKIRAMIGRPVKKEPRK
ncbi:thioredoxin family protein [bacterium]|nr:thioredoxin family protein [bacterium]